MVSQSKDDHLLVIALKALDLGNIGKRVCEPSPSQHSIFIISFLALSRLTTVSSTSVSSKKFFPNTTEPLDFSLFTQHLSLFKGNCGL